MSAIGAKRTFGSNGRVTAFGVKRTLGLAGPHSAWIDVLAGLIRDLHQIAEQLSLRRGQGREFPVNVADIRPPMSTTLDSES
jgi:hypothetical protein